MAFKNFSSVEASSAIEVHTLPVGLELNCSQYSSEQEECACDDRGHLPQHSDSNTRTCPIRKAAGRAAQRRLSNVHRYSNIIYYNAHNRAKASYLHVTLLCAAQAEGIGGK
jgi:hypothetical protein